MRAAAAILALVAAVPAGAQARQCSVPRDVPQPRADGPDARQPRRIVPIAGYTLALTWSPQHCRERGDTPGAAFQCASGNDFDFTLHGLWPDGRAAGRWPQYCAPAPILPRAVIARNLCTTPSAQLLQHEYAKHGTCMGVGPVAYFARARGLYERVRYPDMAALSRRDGLTAGMLATAVARANPGVTPAMLRVRATRDGWLDELWLCLDTGFRPVRCPAHQRGAAAGERLRIWRGQASMTRVSG